MMQQVRVPHRIRFVTRHGNNEQRYEFCGDLNHEWMIVGDSVEGICEDQEGTTRFQCHRGRNGAIDYEPFKGPAPHYSNLFDVPMQRHQQITITEPLEQKTYKYKIKDVEPQHKTRP